MMAILDVAIKAEVKAKLEKLNYIDQILSVCT